MYKIYYEELTDRTEIKIFNNLLSIVSYRHIYYISNIQTFLGYSWIIYPIPTLEGMVVNHLTNYSLRDYPNHTDSILAAFTVILDLLRQVLDTPVTSSGNKLRGIRLNEDN